MANRGSIYHQAALVGCLYLSVAVMLFLPARLQAQAQGTVSNNPVTPLGVSPIRIVNYPQPIRHGLHLENIPLKNLFTSYLENWSSTFSASYQFLNQRSRVGGISLDSESVAVDFAAAQIDGPFTSFDISYAYSYASGSSPTGTSQTVNQHVGSVRVLQPLEPFIPGCSSWLPAVRSFHESHKTLNSQFGIILAAGYGGSLSSTDKPRLPTIHSSAQTFIGNALLDYQFAWCKNPLSDIYADFFFEFSSGIQFSTTRLDSSDLASVTSGRQLTYQNIGSLNYSFWHRFGILVAAEWDAPLDSNPLRGSKPYYSNIAVFTVGLTYNYSPGERPAPQLRMSDLSNSNRWSLGLFYSYTAFDPFTETNQLQVQVSYSF